jgi:ABC-type transporter Mla subunit MlaD
MADVTVDVTEVNRVATRLNHDSATIVTELTSLRTAVVALLGDADGGLWLAQASPVLAASFQEFHKTLNDAIANIPSFAETFSTVARELENMDSDLAHPPPSQ